MKSSVIVGNTSHKILMDMRIFSILEYKKVAFGMLCTVCMRACVLLILICWFIDHRLCLVNMNILALTVVALRHKIVVTLKTYNFDYVVLVISLNENEIPPKCW